MKYNVNKGFIHICMGADKSGLEGAMRLKFPRWLKSGSFGFAEGLALCVGAKPNVPLVRWAKIVFKKVRWEKK